MTMTGVAGTRSETSQFPEIELQSLIKKDPSGNASPLGPRGGSPYEAHPVDEDFDLEAQQTIRQKNDERSAFGRMFVCIETPAQCPNLTCAGFTSMMAVVGLVVLIAGSVFIEDPDLGFGLTVAGGAAMAFSLLDCFAHTFGCCAIKHYIPQRAFDTNVGRLAVENLRLQRENAELKATTEHLEDISRRQAEFAERQKTMNTELSKNLTETTTQLSTAKQELAETTARLEELEKKFSLQQADFQKRLDEAAEVVQKLRETNIDLRKLLVDNNIISGDYQSLESEWESDINILSGEVGEHKQQNQQLQQIMEAAKHELALASTIRDEVRTHGEKIKEQTDRLDETDDKIQSAAQHLNETKQLGSEDNEALREEIAKLKEAVNMACQMLLEKLSENPELMKKIEPILADLADLSEKSEAGTESEKTLDHSE